MAERHDPHAGSESMRGSPASSDDNLGHADQTHSAEALGPFDLRAWGAAGLGIVLGLVVMLAFIRAGS
jgi:hypothetical protein